MNTSFIFFLSVIISEIMCSLLPSPYFITGKQQIIAASLSTMSARLGVQRLPSDGQFFSTYELVTIRQRYQDNKQFRS